MSRRDIYYWKCDRPAAFHGTQSLPTPDEKMEWQLLEVLKQHFKTQSVLLKTGAGQGNHLIWKAEVEGTLMFVRVENGPEQDGHLQAESLLLDRVRTIGVPTPLVYGCDATRCRVPFAWQALQSIDDPDLNYWHKQGQLETSPIAFQIGAAIARWQNLTFREYGPVDETLRGCHPGYADYFHLRLDRHLAFLVSHDFLTFQQGQEIAAEIENHRPLLQLEQGCLVHKDLALWNILGTPRNITAFIDFDDAISGDPMDDLSLLGCFHDSAFLGHAIAGYQSHRPLPQEHLRRFWLHLLRNMIVKSVIRVGAGYFEREDDFFLIGPGSNGRSLRQFTLERLALALHGLRNNSPLLFP